MTTRRHYTTPAGGRCGAYWTVALALISATLLCGDPAAVGQELGIEKSVRPGANERYLAADVDVDHWVEVFEGESREIYTQRHKIVEALNLKPGMAVADIGAGTGLFVGLFAQQVGAHGWVYAVDIAPKFVEHIRNRMDVKGLAQVTTVLGSANSVTLPPASIDVAFVCDVYHHFEYPQSTLASILRALRPGGTFIVIEFARIPGTSKNWIVDHVRAGKEVFRAEIEAVGFRFVGEVAIDGLDENYFLRFVKP
jgi:SAM-dependent methyltransferase